MENCFAENWMLVALKEEELFPFCETSFSFYVVEPCKRILQHTSSLV